MSNSANDSAPSGPLLGLRVLDLATAVSGAFAAMLLGDFGAEVVKIEPPQGDQARQWGPFHSGQARMFQAWNRNKRSLAVDLTTESGREIVYKLVTTADIVIENYRAGVSKRLAIDYETLKPYNPQLIYCSVTAFGDRGPYRERPAYDQILQAISGAAAKNEDFGGNAAICSVPIADYGTALLVMGAVNAALFHRAQTGEGQRIETSLLQGAMTMQSHYFVDMLGSNSEGNAGIFPNEIFPTKDGLIQISAPTDKFWKIFCETIGAHELLEDPAYANNSKRVSHAADLKQKLESHLAKRTADEWEPLFISKGLPCSTVRKHEDFFVDPQVTEMNMNPILEHPVAGPIRTIGVPVDFEKSPGRIQCPSPILGQHTRDILAEIGYDAAQISALQRDGIVVAAELSTAPDLGS